MDASDRLGSAEVRPTGTSPGDTPPESEVTVTMESGHERGAAAFQAGTGAPKRWGTLELRQLIGRGGFGEVYRAWDPQLDREVALKLLYNRDGNTPLEATLESEGRLLAKLRHPNIVTVYGLAKHDNRVGLWMEFLRGRTLDQLIAAQGRFGDSEAASIARDVCRATAAVHSAGLIHRDIKAQNVIREEGGRIVLTDFGLGKRYVPDAPDGRLAGTPAYMAPELFEGTAASVATDLYALGALLFYLVTAEFPVDGRGATELVAAHRAGRRRHLADLRPDLPDRFTRLVARAIDPDPAKRFATAGQLLAELSSFQVDAALLDSGPIGDVPSASATRSERTIQPAAPPTTPSRRHLLRYGIAGATVTVAGGGWLVFTRSTAPSVAANSIVVLPFEDLSKQPGDEFLADAITDELINTLTKSELCVVARTSAFRLKGTSYEPRQIGERLGVETLLTGTIRRNGRRVRVSVQLVRASTGFQIWADSYEQQETNALAIEQQISERVGVSLRANLMRAASTGSASALRSGNWEAHNAYAQGRFYATRRTIPSLKTAIGFYESALKLDPGYALAYAGLADAYAYVGVLQPSTPELVARIKQLGLRALQLDPSLSEAHTTLGQIAHLYDWDAGAAEDHFRRALQHNPRLSEARRHYAGLLINLKRTSEARAELDLALAVDPLSVLLQLSRVLVDYIDGAYDLGEQRLARLMESDPNIPNAYQLSGLFQLKRERRAEAVAAVRRSVEVSRNSQSFRAFLGYVLGICGQAREARAILHELLEEAKSRSVDPVNLATVYAGLGEKEAALSWLDKAVVAHSPNLVQLLVRPTWEGLRGEAGFAALLQRVTLFRDVSPRV